MTRQPAPCSSPPSVHQGSARRAWGNQVLAAGVSLPELFGVQAWLSGQRGGWGLGSAAGCGRPSAAAASLPNKGSDERPATASSGLSAGGGAALLRPQMFLMRSCVFLSSNFWFIVLMKTQAHRDQSQPHRLTQGSHWGHPPMSLVEKVIHGAGKQSPPV